MPLSEAENHRRAFRFQNPEWIPLRTSVSLPCWREYGVREVEALCRRHPRLFPDFRGAPDLDVARENTFWKKGRQRDAWGCLWENPDDGIAGIVVESPLESWDGFENFSPPDPDKTDGWRDLDWPAIRRNLARLRGQGGWARGALVHGHTFLLLTYLRGFENALLDMMEERPEFDRLVEMVASFNEAIVRRYLDAGADAIATPEDLGMQKGPMISPALFRKHIKPAYRRVMEPAKEAGALIVMHSDGDVMSLVDDLIECGVDALNIQDLVNGVDNIAERLKGRVAIDLDIDRQEITVRGTPREIDDHVRECVEKLDTPRGGLGLTYGFYVGTPLENADAVWTAMEKYSVRK